MRRLLIMLCAASLFVGCATTFSDPVARATRSKLTAEAVNAHLNEHRYRIFVDRMYPAQVPSQYLNNDYGIEVSNDSIGLFLPYWGRLYHAPIAMNEHGLYFIQPLQSYDEQPIKEGRRIMITTRNRSEVFKITIEQYFNTTTSITVSATERDLIRYTGVMSLNDIFIRK